jgi:phospholipid/cholesterol/gamma-HCH transport system substrate-binding protein
VRISKEVKVAVLGVVAVVALFFGYKFLKGSDLFSSSRTYYAVYDSVDGLTISNPVILNGVKVGIVQDVKLIPARKNQICVKMDIDKEIDVGDSTVANLSSSSILGGKAITLVMGRNSIRYDGNDTLRSFIENSLTNMLAAKAMPLIGSVDSTLIKINSFFDKDAKKSLQATLLNAQGASETLKNILIMNQRNMNEITANLSELTYSLKSTQQKFDRLAGNLTTISDTLKNSELNATIRNMNNTISEAQVAVKKFNQNTGTLGKLMNDDSLYNNLNNTAASMDALMIDLKANPKRYVHFSVFGKSAGSGDTKIEKANVVAPKGNGPVIIKEVNQVDSTGKTQPKK